MAVLAYVVGSLAEARTVLVTKPVRAGEKPYSSEKTRKRSGTASAKHKEAGLMGFVRTGLNQQAMDRVFHPVNDSPYYVQPNGAGITNTITRPEVAAMEAVFLHGNFHIATDSLPSLHPIQKKHCAQSFTVCTFL
eukprot:1147550-Pelagomonas_calceolata.AAC.1